MSIIFCLSFAAFSFVLLTHDLVASCCMQFCRYAHDNYDGVLVVDQAVAVGGDTTIKDATIKNNIRRGMTFRNTDVTVDDSDISYNGEDGIRISGDDELVKVTFEGIVSSHHNNKKGIFVGRHTTPDYNADVVVDGMLNTYLNGEDGIFVNQQSQMNLSFTVADGGSFNSCQNDGFDIQNKGPSTFVDDTSDGDGYTCGPVETGSNGSAPTCVACPACD